MTELPFASVATERPGLMLWWPAVFVFTSASSAAGLALNITRPSIASTIGRTCAGERRGWPGRVAVRLVMTVSPVTGRSGPWGFTRDSSERGSERRDGPHLRAAGQH